MPLRTAIRHLPKLVTRPWFLFALLLAVYAALLLPTLARQGVSWDEQTDLNITHAYFAAPLSWLTGSPIDASQTRLPMAGTALVYALFGVRDLITARLVSSLVGALTLLGVFQYGRLRGQPQTGLLAAAILATSPFFLSFARIAFTESDIYLACAAIWLLAALVRFQQQPTVARAAGVGLLLGLCISAKFTALAFLPAVWYATVRASRSSSTTSPRRSLLPLLLVTAWLGLVGLLTWAGPAFGLVTSAWQIPHLAFALLGWALPVGWAFTRQRQAAPLWPVTAGFISVLGLLTFLVVPPEHFANPEILRSLLWRADHEMSFNPAFIGEAAGLHLLSILFKSSLLIGAGLLASVLLALRQWRRAELHLPLLMVIFYFGGLISLPLAQTFYTVPLLPLLALLAADQFLGWWSRHRRSAAVLGAAAVLALLVDLALCYPDYNLNGYQWLGARPLLGRSSISYRSVVQTTSDGVQQEFEWLNQHAGAGQTVLTYIQPWHIVEAVAPHPAYRIVDGSQHDLPRPDFVAVQINAEIWTGWSAGDTPRMGQIFHHPYDRAWLEANYHKVFSVERAFGVEMASVWQRNDIAP